MLDREQPCNQEIHHEDSRYLHAQAIVTQVAEAIRRGPVWPAVGLCRSLGAAIGGALVEVGSGYQGADEEVRVQRLSQEHDGKVSPPDRYRVDEILDDTIDAAAGILESVGETADELLSDAVARVRALGREAAELRMKRIWEAEQLNEDYTILNGLELLANMNVVHPEASEELLRFIAFDTWKRDGKVCQIELIHLVQLLAGTESQPPSKELGVVTQILWYVRGYTSKRAID